MLSLQANAAVKLFSGDDLLPTGGFMFYLPNVHSAKKGRLWGCQRAYLPGNRGISQNLSVINPLLVTTTQVEICGLSRLHPALLCGTPALQMTRTTRCATNVIECNIKPLVVAMWGSQGGYVASLTPQSPCSSSLLKILSLTRLVTPTTARI